MSAFQSPARSHFSHPSSPPPSPPDQSSSDGERTHPPDHPTATTPPPSNRLTHSLPPTPPEDETVPRDPSFDAAALEEGVIDLRPGTDYSSCPDVFQYLKLVGWAVGCRKGPLARAERGRRYLERRAAENKGLFVPPENYIRSPSPLPGAVRYDKSTALKQLPFSTTSIWPKLLEAHLDSIGEAARVRLEEPDLADIRELCREEQHDRVVKGLSWELRILPLNRQTLKGSILMTNIRAPIPKFETKAPEPHSPEYARLIAYLYIPQRHPLGYALRLSGYGELAIMGLLSNALIAEGFSVVRPRYPKPRYDAPWLDWSHDVELKYAKRHDPLRWQAWMDEKEAEKAKPTRKLTGYEERELLLRRTKSWCRHDEPKGHCEECFEEETESD